jgi:glycosyltransferase involved in cell wall biosynthesis
MTSSARAATVSVALCTHNGAAHLEEQLRSILEQSVLPDEVVISDDASSDSTLAIAQAIFDDHPRALRPRLVILNNPEPLGVTRNFEQALLACSSDLIALCDQDDVWHRDRLRVALGRFEQSPTLELLHSDARLVDEQGAALGHSLFQALEIGQAERDAIHSGDAFAALLRRNLVTGATVMVRRELVHRAAPFPSPWVHDEWLAVITATTGVIDLSEQQLIDYRQHGANQIGVSKLGLRGKFGRLFEFRNDRNDYLLDRAQVLLGRLQELGAAVSPRDLELARGKVEHHRVRAALPARRLKRWAPVLKEVATGRYSRFSRGWADVVRDLVQPGGAAVPAERRKALW